MGPGCCESAPVHQGVNCPTSVNVWACRVNQVCLVVKPKAAPRTAAAEQAAPRAMVSEEDWTIIGVGGE